jgi:hypothetical protein
MEAVYSSETLIIAYKTTLCQNTEDQIQKMKRVFENSIGATSNTLNIVTQNNLRAIINVLSVDRAVLKSILSSFSKRGF